MATSGVTSSQVDDDDDDEILIDPDNKAQRKLMQQARKCYKRLYENEKKDRKENDEESAMSQLDIDQHVPITEPITHSNGVYSSVNPYLEIFNVATTLAGVYPFETVMDEERDRIQNVPEPIFFMTDPGDEDLIDEDEEMVIDDISKEKTELKQLPIDIIQRIPVTRHLKPNIVTRDNYDMNNHTHSTIDAAEDTLLSSKMKQYVGEMVESQIEEWNKEGKLTSREETNLLAQQLRQKLCMSLTSQIKDYITGQTPVNHPLPELRKGKR